MSIQDIFNYHQATDQIATSGQPLAEEFKDIATNGYQAVVNLAMHDSDDAIADEGSIVASLRMTYFHIPVPFDAPTSEHLRIFINIMECLQGKKVWVHCALNYRVSAFMYHYLRLHGFSPEEARSPIFEYLRPDEIWQQIRGLSRKEIGVLLQL